MGRRIDIALQEYEQNPSVGFLSCIIRIQDERIDDLINRLTEAETKLNKLSDRIEGVCRECLSSTHEAWTPSE
jgi:hypothetical protein